jgi:hypothetical protein
MRNLRNRVSALALAMVMASGMSTAFSARVSAFDGSAPTNEGICATLATVEAGLANVANPFLKAVLQKLIDAAQAKLQCQ